MTKSYQPYSDLLIQKKLDSKQVKAEFMNSECLQVIKRLLPNLKSNHIYFGNFTSLSVQTSPSHIRLRKDKFLQEVEKRNLDCLLVNICQHHGHVYYHLFFGYSFVNYPYKTNSSNSFICFDFDEFFPNNQDLETGIMTKDIHKKQETHTKTKLIYLRVLRDNLDIPMLTQAVNSIKQININYYSNLSTNHGQSVSDSIRTQVLNTYPRRCICSVGESVCCNKGMDWDVYEHQPSNNQIHLHHFIPKQYFKNIYSDQSLDWQVINKPLNLVPICPSCHEQIHNGDPTMKHQLVTKIFEVMKQVGIYDQWLAYLNYHHAFIKLTPNDIIQNYLDGSNGFGKQPWQTKK